MAEWSKAVEVFVVGFSGVFIVLVILQLCIFLYSKIIVLLPGREAKK